VDDKVARIRQLKAERAQIDDEIKALFGELNAELEAERGTKKRKRKGEVNV
jgi:hypothetical protein